MQDLEEDVKREQALVATTSNNPTVNGEGKEDKGKVGKREVSPAIVLQQLALLRNDLSALPLHDEREREGPISLEQKLKSSESFLAREQVVESGKGEEVKELRRVREDEGVLESRLSIIENLVGARESDVNDVRSPSLPPSLRLLTNATPRTDLSPPRSPPENPPTTRNPPHTSHPTTSSRHHLSTSKSARHRSRTTPRNAKEIRRYSSVEFGGFLWCFDWDWWGDNCRYLLWNCGDRG